MSMPYRLVIFDWEGTLGDTLGPVLHLIAVEAERLQLGEFDEWDARKYVVLGLPRALNKIFPHLSLHQQEQLIQAVQESLATHASDVCLIPGAELVVRQLKQEGIGLAIATNKGQQSLQRALQASALADCFKVTRAAGQVPAKPCPQMLEEIMEECGVTPSETLMVGDSEVDIEMAQLAGVDAVGVDFDHIQGARLRAAGALDVFNDYQQLANYLKLGADS